ncbi:MAG: VCBS repeat-containing protein [Acidobacteria bacterium]|nr:VCBS repeat-containing protein [Acidobacteriota bacterium]
MFFPRSSLFGDCLSRFGGLSFAIAISLCVYALRVGAACPVLSFAPPSTLSDAGNSLAQLRSGDFNNDGKLDLVTGDTTGGGRIQILPGNGTGGFGAPLNYTLGVRPTFAETGDLNLDGKLDLVVSLENSSQLALLLGDGMGGFSARINFTGSNSTAYGVAIGDFNTDGKPDVVVADYDFGRVRLLLGDGMGGFAAPVGFVAGNTPYDVVARDFNGDGKLDLAVTNYEGLAGHIFLLFGDGMGGFPESGSGSEVGSNPRQIVAKDLNGDGKLDLLVVGSNISVLLGNGMGNFSSVDFAPTAGGVRSADVADLNGDGRVDIAVAAYNSRTVRVFNGSGAGTFAQTMDFAVNQNPTSILIADLNADANPDLIVQGEAPAKVQVLLHTCVAPTPDDFDGDHRSDLSVARPGATNFDWYVLLSSGNSLLGQQWGLTTDRLAPADYDGDGKTDFAIYRPSNGLFWVIRSSTSTFTAGRAIDTPSPQDVPVSADYSGDGIADFAVWRYTGGTQGQLLYRSSFIPNGTVEYFVNANAADKPLAGNFDTLGRSSLALFNTSTGVWKILTLSTYSTRTVQWGFGSDIPAPGDYDGDGKYDVAVFRPSVGGWYILQSSDNSFRGVQFGANGDRPAPADYDGDSKFDLAVFRPTDGNWYILNSNDSSFRADHFGTNGDLPIPAAYLP